MLNILTLDGGPGPMLQIRLMQRLERDHFPGFLENVDLFAGTSDGALMALYMAKALSEGATAAEAIAGCMAFSDKYSHAFAKDSSPLRFLMGVRPFTNGNYFKRVIRDEFGSTTLGDLKKKVVITSFDTLAWVPRMFRNFGSPADVERDCALTLVEVALSTSSLPIVMPIHGGQGNRGYLDGFMCSNNPSMSAVSLAAKHLVPRGENPLEYLNVLSLGVAQTYEEALLERGGGLIATLAMLFSHDRFQRFVCMEKTPAGVWRFVVSADWREKAYAEAHTCFEGTGAQSWGWFQTLLLRPTFLLDLLVHGLNGEVDRQCKRLLGEERYHRYDPRVGLMRDVMSFMVDRGRRSRAGADVTTRRCFGDRVDGPTTADDRSNVEDTQALIAWMAARWPESYAVRGRTTVNSANSPSVDSAVMAPP